MELRGCEAVREWGRAKGGDVNEAELGDVAALEGVVGFDGARVRPGVRPHAEGLVTDDCQRKWISSVAKVTHTDSTGEMIGYGYGHTHLVVT